MKVTLYSTGCPKCNVLKKKLEQKEITFFVCNDTEQMQSIGIKQVPMLQIDDNPLMPFGEAVAWVNNFQAK